MYQTTDSDEFLIVPGEQYKLKIIIDEKFFTTLKAVFLNENQKGNPFFQPIISPNNIEGKDVYSVFAGFRLFEKTITFIPD